MIKKLLKKFRGQAYQSNKRTNSYRNENGFMSFMEDYLAYTDSKDLYL